MPKIFQSIKKIFVVGSGGGFIASVVKPAIQQTLILSGRMAETAAGFAVSASRHVARVAQNPAVLISLLNVTGTSTTEQKPAFSLSTLLGFRVEKAPAAKITQITYSLVRRVGGNAQAAVGNAWTNPANAINGTDGLHNGSSATCAGSVGGNTFGIELDYLDHVNKSELTITDAKLHFYCSVTGDNTGLRSSMALSYNIGAGLVALETVNGNFNALTTPRTHTIPLTTWAQFNALKARVVETCAAVSNGVTASLDAIEIEITAVKTDTF